MIRNFKHRGLKRLYERDDRSGKMGIQHYIASCYMRRLISFFTACSAIAIFASSLYAQTSPVPFINNPLVPDSAAPGSPGFTLSVNGTGLVSGATVNWNGSPRATTFVSSTQLKVAVLTADLLTAATVPVTVTNPTPGGGTSNSVLFQVTPRSTTAGVWCFFNVFPARCECRFSCRFEWRWKCRLDPG